MTPPKVFVTRMIPEEGLTMIRDVCDPDIWEGDLPPSREVLLQHIEGVDGILSLLTDTLDEEAMDRAGPNLRVISNYAVGYDNIDIPEATRRGIPVGHTPGVLTDTTADFAFALLLAAARRLVEGDRYTRAGKWQTWGPRLLLGGDVYGATLGIIGFGRIGKAVAKRATGFDMRILYYDPACKEDEVAAQIGAECVDLDTLLASSDFVTLHVPLTDATRHLIGMGQLRAMKSTAVLVNTSRGPTVDHDALAQALAQGEIAYAALDVTEPEPIPLAHPLLQRENVIIVPHIASASVATRGRMARMAAANLIAGLQGKRLPYPVNPVVYEG